MKARDIRSVRCAIAFGEGIEALEERSLFSAPYEFASVGFRFDAGAPAVFEMLGQLGADSAVSGAQTMATLAGAQTGPIDWATYQTMSRRAVTTPGSGIDPYSQQSADNFLADMGFSFGSLVGSFGNDAPTDVAFIGYQPEHRADRGLHHVRRRGQHAQHRRVRRRRARQGLLVEPRFERLARRRHHQLLPRRSAASGGRPAGPTSGTSRTSPPSPSRSSVEPPATFQGKLMRTTHLSRCLPTDDPGLDALEPRTLFSAPWDFAGVGVRFGMGGPSVFQSVGTLNADESVSGTSTFAGVAGTPQTDPIDYATINLLTHGRALTTARSGGAAYEDQVGVNFLSDLGYALGALYGRTGGTDPLTDVSFLVQREQGHPIDWASYQFDFQYLEFSAGGAAFRNGQFRAAGGMIQWTDAGSTTSIGISSQDTDGTLHLADGRTVFTSARVIGPDVSVGFPTIGEITLIVDTDNSDGTVGIGIARRYQEFFNFANGVGRAGAYRASVLTSGSVGDDFFAAQTISPGVGSARVVIDLNASGHFFMCDMAAYDTGDRTVISSGTWRANLPSEQPVRFNSVILTDQAGRVANFTISYNGGLIAASVQSAAHAPEEQLVGSATTFNGVPAQRFFEGGHVALDENGHPVYYETDIDYSTGTGVQSWYSEDLLDLWGGSPLVTVGSSRISPNASIAFVLGVDADGNVLAWERLFGGGRWSFRNITSEFGADPIVSDLTVFDWRANLTGVPPGGTGQALAVAGKNAAGDIFLYSPSLEYSETGFHGWSVFNVSDQLTGPTPVWSGPVQGYQTPWGGVNIAGVDADGDVVVAWTSSELVDAWESANLSQIAGTPPLQGAVSVMLTPWNAIHITGLDSQGAVHVTWWAPGFGPTWVDNDLTLETGGPLLDTGRTSNHGTPVVSFIGVNNTLNIAGYDADGHIRIYWWLPGAGWNIGDVNWSFPAAENPDSLAYTDSLGSDDVNSDYSPAGQSMYGYNTDGSFSRVWWAEGGADAWQIQNLTDLATTVTT